jgi:hypothetical protein
VSLYIKFNDVYRMNAFFVFFFWFECFISETRAAERTSMKFGVTNLQYMSGEFNFGSYRCSVTATLYISEPKFVTSPTSLPERKVHRTVQIGRYATK